MAFDNFKNSYFNYVIKNYKKPDEEVLVKNGNDYTYGIIEWHFTAWFYDNYIRRFGHEFIQTKIGDIKNKSVYTWAVFGLNKYQTVLDISNDDFDNNLYEISNELHCNFQVLYNKFNKYKPFLTNYDYYRFAYENVDSHDIIYFYILLIIYIDNDYPIKTVLDTDASVKEELMEFQRELVNKFCSLAPKEIKEKAVGALFKAFQQINETNKYEPKLSLSLSSILYNDKVPLSGPIYIQWDKVEFYDGFYLIYHPNERRSKEQRPYMIRDDKSRKVFNDISSIFMKKLSPLYVLAENGRIVNVLNKQELSSCISVMEYKVAAPSSVKKQKSPIKVERKEISRSEAITLCKDFKSKFLEYLSNKQLDNYNVVCCVENKINANRVIEAEYSFIFTFKESKDKLFLAFENTKDSRCTYVFPVSKTKWKESIDLIFNFFASNLVNKRQQLAMRLADLELPGNFEYKRILHTEYLVWANRIRCCM